MIYRSDIYTTGSSSHFYQKSIIVMSNVRPVLLPIHWHTLLGSGSSGDPDQVDLALRAFLQPSSVNWYPRGHSYSHFPLTHWADAKESNAVQSSPSPEPRHPPQLNRSDEISTHSYQFRLGRPLLLFTGHDLYPGGQTIDSGVCNALLYPPPPPPPPMLPVGVGVQVT